MGVKKCGKQVGKTKSGKSRGLCIKPKGHAGKCTNGTCKYCGVVLTKSNAPPSAMSGVKNRRCHKCRQEEHGGNPRNYQVPGSRHTFPCGCTGILPEKGFDNLFAAETSGGVFTCRARLPIYSSKHNAKKRGYKPIDPFTPHSLIRKMMEENCVLCGEALVWTFGRMKTPHLHHNHETGKVIGFAHPKCNLFELQQRVLELRAENVALRQQMLSLAA